MSESEWRERAQTAEATIETAKQAHQLAIERVRDFKANFGVRERSDGSIDIDFDKFAERLGLHGCVQLRKVIDEKYRISGEMGEKPRIKLAAGGS